MRSFFSPLNLTGHLTHPNPLNHAPLHLNWAVRSKTPPDDFWHAATIRPASRTSGRTAHTSRTTASVAGGAAGRYSRASLSCVGAGPGSLSPAAVDGPARGSGGSSSTSNDPLTSAACYSPRSRSPSSCCYCHCLQKMRLREGSTYIGFVVLNYHCCPQMRPGFHYCAVCPVVRYLLE